MSEPKLRLRNGEVVYLNTINYDEADMLACRIENEMESIRQQVLDYERPLSFINPEVKDNANKSLSQHGQNLRLLRVWMRKHKRDKVRSIDNIFVTICRQRMTKELFDAIVTEAKRHYDEGIYD